MAHSSRPSSPLCDAVPKTVEPVVDPPLANMARPAVVEDYSSEDELDELDGLYEYCGVLSHAANSFGRYVG